ncbi:MAG: hypothetical protein JW892_07780 [Anaerolineae bacterium]|nr:hypothetical protein [Anaerolineae bacterium]
MLLVTRAPLRLVLSGEGSLGAHYLERQDSALIMATIGYHTYSLITPGPTKGIRVISSDHGEAFELLSCESCEIDAALGVAKAAICYLNLCDGITVSLASQMPPHVGLGSPNAVATAVIKGLAFWSGLDLGAAEVADLAGNIETPQGSLGVNKEDTYAIALGGLNLVRKTRNRINVEPFALPASTEAELEANLMLFLSPDLGGASNSKELATDELQANDASHKLQQINTAIQTALERGDLKEYGELLHRARLINPSTRLAPTTPLERGYRLARSLGAWGGVISPDEENTGTLMLVCPPQAQGEVSQALMQMGLVHRPIPLIHEGVELFQTLPWPTAQTWQDLYVNRQENVKLR